jgi:hypothetical protein
MNTEDIIKLYSIGAISREYFGRIAGLWEECDEDRVMEVSIEYYQEKEYV